MTIKPKVRRYNARAEPPAPTEEVDSPAQVQSENTIDAIRREGLTGRQLRMARRVAQKHGIAATSDFDALKQLRDRGIDPFQRSGLMDMVGKRAPSRNDQQEPEVQLPQVAPGKEVVTRPPPVQSGLEHRASEIQKMQRDIARRRRKNVFLLVARLLFFVAVPTTIAAYYFANIATPMFATRSHFVIQQASSGGGAPGGIASMFQGTSMATQQDSISVQSYLASEAAMKRLDADHGFRAAFSAADVDALQRLAPNATDAEAYRIYKKRIKIAYDPTEGLVRMEVSAPSAELAMAFNEALISYAEEQVDQMTLRLRGDQMQGALDNYHKTEQERSEALRELTRLKSEAEILNPEAENAALMGRINSLQSQRDRLDLELASLLDNPRPNAARVDGARASIARIDQQIGQLRGRITETSGERLSQSEITALVREAEENYQVRLALVQEAMRQMETARIEANRQVRYLSLSVPPTKPDAATYPRFVENTALSFLVFAGLYIMMSLTSAVLKEQIAS